MSIIAPFLKNTITAIYSVTTDAYNDNTLTKVYSSVPCRWEEEMEEESTNSGITKEFGIRCWILPEYDVKSSYIVEYNNVQYEVVASEKYTDVFGKHDHTVIYLGFLR